MNHKFCQKIRSGLFVLIAMPLGHRETLLPNAKLLIILLIERLAKRSSAVHALQSDSDCLKLSESGAKGVRILSRIKGIFLTSFGSKALGGKIEQPDLTNGLVSQNAAQPICLK